MSIIVPAYNCRRTLKRALRSALRQTADKEVICIDDGSDDGTSGMLDRFARWHSEVRVFHREHRGTAAARNLGLESARGEFVAFLDADDIYPDRASLQRMADLAHEKDVRVVGSLRTLYIDKNLNYKETYREECQGHPGGFVTSFREVQYEYDFTSYIFRRDLLEDIRFPDLRRYQDVPFFVQAMARADRYAVADVEGYRYTIDSHRMPKYDVLMARDLLRGISMVQDLARENGLAVLESRCPERLKEYSAVLGPFTDDPEVRGLIGKITASRGTPSSASSSRRR